ncbi:hypothetical protein [Chryseobacterium sp. JK1]|uniref:hypothetical protein n=1 Tax=Chryseobacterium sp. JK1 TaxID=874294 RepID=UPI003D6933A7
MKNPKTNPAIEAIKKRLMSDIGYIPGDNIPNSTVSKTISLLDATATLEYAKSLKRPVRMAKSDECQFSIELQKKMEKEETGFKDVKSAAKYLNVSETTINKLKREKQITEVSKYGKAHFRTSELDLIAMTNPFFIARA